MRCGTFVGEIIRVYRPHARLMTATFDAATHDPSLRAMTDAFMNASANDLRKHIRRGQAGGWVVADLHAEQSAAQLTWLAERSFHQLPPGASDAAVRRLGDPHTHIVFSTLYAAASS